MAKRMDRCKDVLFSENISCTKRTKKSSSFLKFNLFIYSYLQDSFEENIKAILSYEILKSNDCEYDFYVHEKKVLLVTCRFFHR